MTLELVQALHRIESTVPYAYVVFLAVACILITWRMTVWLVRRDYERWLHLHGDKALREKLIETRAERDQLRKEVTRLNTRLRGAIAALRGLNMELGKVHELLMLAEENAKG